MLTTITLNGFKSYKSAKIILAPLTVLIGANASGKSNAIEGMRLLSWLAQGRRLNSIQYAVQSERVVRGTIDDLSFERCGKFELGAETDRAEWNKLSMCLEQRKDGLHISSEQLAHSGSNVPLYILDQPSQAHSSDVGVAYNNFQKGGKKPHTVCSDQAAIFTQLTFPSLFDAKHKASRDRIPPITKEIEKWLSNMLFLDPVPPKMREYSFPSEDTLHGDGANLSAVLYNLWGGNHDKDMERLVGETEPYKSNRKAILSFIQSLPEQDIDSLGFLIEPRGGVMVSLTETFGGVTRDYDASLLSDGTLRVLSIAAAMLSAPEESLVIIEEIDNGVHPSRAQHLLKQILHLAEKRGVRVLLSTHNPALLNALPDSALPDVLFCYRDSGQGCSKIVRLQDLPDYPELIAQDTLGGLVTNGTLERFVKIPKNDNRQMLAEQWLEEMKKGIGRDE